MLDTAYLLHTALETICPVLGVSIGDQSDKRTWRIDYADGTTKEQEQALQQLLATFDPATAVKPMDVAGLLSRVSALEANVTALDAATSTPLTAA